MSASDSVAPHSTPEAPHSCIHYHKMVIIHPPEGGPVNIYLYDRVGATMDCTKEVLLQGLVSNGAAKKENSVQLM